MTMPDHQNVQAGSLSHPGGLLRHSDRVRAYYDSDAYLAQNVIVPIRARLVKDLLGDLHDARVLDLGCGDGSISRSLLAGGNRLTLVDFSAPMLKRARDATPPGAAVEFVESDLSDYQPSECFDVVMCVGVLAHVPSPPATMQHLGRLVRPGGRCLIQITDDGVPLGWGLNRYYSWRRREGWQLNVMTRGEIQRIAAEHGLHEISRRRYGLLLPGSGRSPYSVRHRMERAAAKRPLSRLASQLLIVFRRG